MTMKWLNVYYLNVPLCQGARASGPTTGQIGGVWLPEFEYGAKGGG